MASLMEAISPDSDGGRRSRSPRLPRVPPTDGDRDLPDCLAFPQPTEIAISPPIRRTRGAISSVPSLRDRVLREPDLLEPLAGGDPNLGLDEIDAGDDLSDSVLDLDAWVHLHEVVLPRLRIHKELDSARAEVAGARRDAHLHDVGGATESSFACHQRQSEAISGNQSSFAGHRTQFRRRHAIRRNQTQSSHSVPKAPRVRRDAHRIAIELQGPQSDAIRRNQTQSDAIRRRPP